MFNLPHFVQNLLVDIAIGDYFQEIRKIMIENYFINIKIILINKMILNQIMKF